MKTLAENWNQEDFELPGNRIYSVVTVTKHIDDHKNIEEKKQLEYFTIQIRTLVKSLKYFIA